MKIGELIEKAWSQYCENIGEWFLILLCMGLVTMGVSLCFFPVILFFLFLEAIFVESIGGYSVITIFFLIPVICSLRLLMEAMSIGGYSSISLSKVKSGCCNIGDIFYIFYHHPFKFMGLLLLTGIYICLWSLLLIIPGIVKIYSYSQAIFIMIENPEYGINECITKSMEIMDGNKRYLFLFTLIAGAFYLLVSFILYFTNTIVIYLVNISLSFVTTPFYYLFSANFYVKVSGENTEAEMIPGQTI